MSDAQTKHPSSPLFILESLIVIDG